jgi:hypothetical protein
MLDLPDTPDERFQRRRMRRWKRRGRILGPFLGVPILLAALSLSVDWIEYTPQPAPDRLAARPIRMLPKQQTLPTPTSNEAEIAATARPDLTIPIAADRVLEPNRDALDLELMLPSPPPPRPTTSSYVMDQR